MNLDTMYPNGVPLASVYRTGLLHRMMPYETTALIKRNLVAQDRYYLAQDYANISTSTYAMIRPTLIARTADDDYVWHDNFVASVAPAYQAFVDTQFADIEHTYEALQSANVRGHRAAACWCPIAEYLIVALGAHNVVASCDTINIDGVPVKTPPGAYKFILLFDDSDDGIKQFITAQARQPRFSIV